MTNEVKKEYLAKYRLQQAKIRRLCELIEENPEKKAEYDVEINKARAFRDRIEAFVEAVDGGILTEILFQKYLCGKSLEEISYNLHYSQRQTERLHIKALESFSFA